MCFSDLKCWGLGLLGCLSAALSCSVKEDRSDCPCYLTVDPVEVSGTCGDGFPVLLSVSGRQDFLMQRDLESGDCETPLVLEVPRPNVFVSVLAGAGECFIPGEGLVIPYGAECPPVRMFSQRVVTDGETARVVPVLHKAYCELAVRIVPVNDVFLDRFHIAIEGNVTGYAPDSSLLPGDFRSEAYPTAEGVCVTRIPRQRDASLMMTVLEEEKPLRYFALGAYIEQSGYDWLAADLEDIFLEIDYAATAFTIRVGEWEKTVEMEVLI